MSSVLRVSGMELVESRKQKFPSTFGACRLCELRVKFDLAVYPLINVLSRLVFLHFQFEIFAFI